MNTSTFLYILIMLFFFFVGIASGQEFLTEANFNDKTAKDIVAVEFWVDWNSNNQFKELEELKDCQTYRVDIARFPSLQNKYEVVSIPVIIIFESGKEKQRFLPNIMFELDATKKDIQKSIDELMIAKFN
tara:strand:+ start:2001 stop:2390 length:390 start_codon:yes stop_codon:yes gene_type:complete